jgi:hypothetical protein
MTSANAQIKIEQRLEKLSSADAPNILPWQMEEAVNKAVLDWVRRQKHGGNIYREGDEVTVQQVDDLQPLLKVVDLGVTGSSNNLYAATEALPPDYLYFKRLTPNCTKDNCIYVQIRSTLIEEANVDEYLRDYNSQPSFDFEECFHTLIGNTAHVYHNNDFTVVDCKLTYYRAPDQIYFVDPVKSLQNWNWKPDVCELISFPATSNLSIKMLSQRAG